MKNKFNLPIIMMNNPGDPTEVVGGGTGQGGTDPLGNPMSFANWSTTGPWQEYDEYGNGDGTADMEEYGMWWADNGFTYDQWTGIGNSANDWTTYVVPNLP